MEQEILKRAYEKYRIPLLKEAFDYVYDYSLAEDCVQEAFVVLQKRIMDGGTEGLNISAFLSTTVKNAALNIFKASLKERVYGDPEGDVFEVADDSFETECRLREESEYIKECLEHLNPRAKSAVLMRYVYNLSFRDIALRLGISEAGVKKMINRSLKELKKTYNKKGVR